MIMSGVKTVQLNDKHCVQACCHAGITKCDSVRTNFRHM